MRANSRMVLVEVFSIEEVAGAGGFCSSVGVVVTLDFVGGWVDLFVTAFVDVG